MKSSSYFYFCLAAEKFSNTLGPFKNKMTFEFFISTASLMIMLLMNAVHTVKCNGVPCYCVRGHLYIT